MQNMHWKILIIVAALFLTTYSWISNGIKLGKDLQGGLSLVYQINIDPDATAADAAAIVTQTISVLKDRLNPKGVLDITIIAQGRDRIEIIMPLPTEEVRALKDTYENLIEEILTDTLIDEGELSLSLSRGTAVEDFANAEDPEFFQLVTDLQNAYNIQDATEAAHNTAKNDPNLSDEEKGRLAGEYAQAIVTFEDMEIDVLKHSLKRTDILFMLQLPDDERVIRDDDNQIILDEDGNLAIEPGLQTIRLQSLKERFPTQSAKFDNLIKSYNEYQDNRKGFDDPEDLKRMMRGAGVLEFRIAAERGIGEGFNADQLRDDLLANGPDNPTSSLVWWMPINDMKQWYDSQRDLASLQGNPEDYFGTRRGLEAAEYGGKYYLLIYQSGDRKTLTHEAGMPDWELTNAGRTTDNYGRNAVTFRLDSPGGIAMRQLTGANIDKPMAIVLDGEVFSAPNINSAIGSDGIIQGNFSESDISYLIRVLAAGSLQARLSPEPIAENTYGPSIGRDNLDRGLHACLWGIIAVAIFMIIYYFVAGAVADVALLCNGALIFGVMAMQQAAFTLPSIAGIVLTIGMAVDANVLIYERIREEIFAGETDLRTAVRLGYEKALSTIIDANVTNLIVCLVLYRTATAEVKGFALTLGIGILATLFTALFVTRVIYTLYTDWLKVGKLPMLPTVVPAVHRFLEPSINWLNLKKIFIPISLLLVVSSLILVSTRGMEMYDTEFRGGVAMTLKTSSMMERPDFEAKVHAIGELEETAPNYELLKNFANAAVLAAGPNQVGASSDMFQVKVAVESKDASIAKIMVNALIEQMGDFLTITRPYQFMYSDQSSPPAGATFPLLDRTIGVVINRRGFDNEDMDVRREDGGVAVVIDNISPPASVSDIKDRITRIRKHEEYLKTGERSWRVIPIDAVEDGSGYNSIAVVVYDETKKYRDNPEIWQREMADLEWKLITEALRDPPQLEQVNVYSSSVAQTLAANAVVAVVLSLLGILLYIWIRFGSFRYSLAAIIALVHDVSIALGLLALSHTLATIPFFSNFLGISDFRIDLGVVAALLTIIGYSLNDTIVIMDRIRENRGKLPLATAEIVNRSINQTVSRTVLTSLTTLLAIGVMYVAGGTGIRPFAFCLLIGVFVGTYSSVAIAAPLIYRKSDSDKMTPSVDVDEIDESGRILPVGS